MFMSQTRSLSTFDISPKKGSRTKSFSQIRNARAPFIKRAIALAIDGFLITMVSRLLVTALDRVFFDANASVLLKPFFLSPLIQLICALVFIVIPVAAFGQTAGKKLLGLKVVSSEGNEKLSFTDALAREIGGKTCSMLILGIGFLMALSNERLALHDKLMKTYVTEV